MDSFIYGIITKYGQVTGTESIMVDALAAIAGLSLVFALAWCFFGFKMFRFIGAILAFLAVGIAVASLMTASPRSVMVTTMLIVGVVAAFVVFSFYRVAGFIICAVFFFDLAGQYIDNIYICIVIGLIPAVFSFFYSAHVIIIVSSIWGGYSLSFYGLSQFFDLGLPWKVCIAILIAALGAFVQVKMNKEQLKLAR